MRWMGLVVVLGACAEPGEAFVGTWAGTYECDGMWDDGSEYDEGPAAQTIRIERDVGGELYQAGECVIPLRTVSDTRLEYEQSSCAIVLSNGVPVTSTVVSGNVSLRNYFLAYDNNVLIEFEDGSGFYITASCEMTGAERID